MVYLKSCSSRPNKLYKRIHQNPTVHYIISQATELQSKISIATKLVHHFSKQHRSLSYHEGTCLTTANSLHLIINSKQIHKKIQFFFPNWDNHYQFKANPQKDTALFPQLGQPNHNSHHRNTETDKSTLTTASNQNLQL